MAHVIDAGITREHILESLGYVLVIESHAGSAAAIRRALEPDLSAQLAVVENVEEALTSIATRAPDVILTPTFLAPADDARLREHLLRSVATSHTQVVTLPPSVESIQPDGNAGRRPARGVVMRLLGRRRPAPVQRCDGRELREQVKQYLEQAHALRLRAEYRERSGFVSVLASDALAVRSREPWPGVSQSTALLRSNRSESRTLGGYSMPRDRRRASRKRADDLGGQWGIMLPHGEGRVLDLSPLGVSFETSSFMTPGRIVGLQLQGVDRNLPVTARLVRSDVASRRGSEVSYHVAAVFAQEVDLTVSTSRPPVSYPPKVLADLLGRALADANWASNGAGLRAAFETELAALLPVREVRIRAAAVPRPRDCESMCFDIPGDGQSRLTLQAIFEPRHQPTLVEVRLLKAAADLAAVVVALAPLHEATAVRPEMPDLAESEELFAFAGR